NPEVRHTSMCGTFQQQFDYREWPCRLSIATVFRPFCGRSRIPDVITTVGLATSRLCDIQPLRSARKTTNRRMMDMETGEFAEKTLFYEGNAVREFLRWPERASGRRH